MVGILRLVQMVDAMLRWGSPLARQQSESPRMEEVFTEQTLSTSGEHSSGKGAISTSLVRFCFLFQLIKRTYLVTLIFVGTGMGFALPLMLIKTALWQSFAVEAFDIAIAV